MTIAWVVGTLACGALLAAAAMAAERAAGWLRLPRRWPWALAIAGSLAIPALAIAAPEMLGARRPLSAPPLASPRETARAARVVGAGLPEQMLGSGGAPAFVRQPLPRGAGLLWIATSLALAGAFAAGRRRVAEACGPLMGGRVAGIRILVSENAGPMVMGVLEPHVVLPRWALYRSAGELRLMVRHEQEHVAEGDPWLIAAAGVALAAMPWNPALWWMHRRLRLAVEIDCDHRVLDAGESRRRYVDALLDTAARPAFAPCLAWVAGRSHLERRLLAITTRQPRLRGMRALAALSIAVVAGGGAWRVVPPAPVAPRREMRPDNWEMVDTVTFTFGERKEEWRPLGFIYVAPAAAAYPVVQTVSAGSPAERAGLRVGDRILAANGADARRTFYTYKHPSEAYTLAVVRGGVAITFLFPGVVDRAEMERRDQAEAACLRGQSSRPTRPVDYASCRPPELPREHGAPVAPAS